jgi:dTDP-4-dehydrorhamnose 3,5-epimerase-like enzyme
MNINKSTLDGISLIEIDEFSDHRGSFSRLFCNKVLSPILINRQIVQIN